MEILLIGEGGKRIKDKIKIGKVLRKERKLKGDFIIIVNVEKRKDTELALKVLENIEGKKISIVFVKEDREEKRRALEIMDRSDHALFIENSFEDFNDIGKEEINKIIKRIIKGKDRFKGKIISLEGYSVSSPFMNPQLGEKISGFYNFDLTELDYAVYGEYEEKIKKELKKLIKRGVYDKEVSRASPYELIYISHMTKDDRLIDRIAKKIYVILDIKDAFEYGSKKLFEEYLKKEGTEFNIHIIDARINDNRIENLKIFNKYLSEKIKGKNYPILIFIGGGGNNIGNRFTKLAKGKRMHNVFFNTDACHLSTTYDFDYTTTAVLLGKKITRGLGAGGDPKVGEKVMEEEKELIENAIPYGSYYLLYFALGGGTGSASYKIAEMLKKRGKKIIAFTNFPFKLYRNSRKIAKEYYKKVKRFADLIILIEPKRVKDVMKIKEMLETFSIIEEMFARLTKGIIRNYKKFENLKGEYTISVVSSEEKDLNKNALAYGKFKPLFDVRVGKDVFRIMKVLELKEKGVEVVE